MPAAAGFDAVIPYTQVTIDDVASLTQDAIFSRPPSRGPRTGVFIGGRDAVLALDMLEAAKSAMFPPFLISLFADPSGAFTTAAAMIACVERRLRVLGAALGGSKVAVFGAKGVVGGIVGVIAAEAGAEVTLVAHDQSGVVPAKAADFSRRFVRNFSVADGSTEAGRHAILAEIDVAIAAGRAGLQILSRGDLAAARRLKVAADMNAVPPAGIEGVEVGADGASIAGTPGVGIGALAIGGVKFQVQHAMLRCIREAAKAETLDFRNAYRTALEIVG